MKKLYIDLTHDKISGQQNMQKQLKRYCQNVGALTTKEDADILVYVQVEPTQSVDEWKRLKQEGKKIVFIHHVLVKELTDIIAIFTVPGLLELVDLHIIMSVHGDILTALRNRGIDDRKIRIIEQAGAERDLLEAKYFHNRRDLKTICYIGRYRKGLVKFVELTKNLHDWQRTIFCPDIHKYNGDLQEYAIETSLTNFDLFDRVAQHSFTYSPYIYHQPYMHLETIMHEAVHCGTAVVVDDEFENVVPNFKTKGFVDTNEFLTMKRDVYRSRVKCCSAFLYNNFQSCTEIQKNNFDTIQSYFDH